MKLFLVLSQAGGCTKEIQVRRSPFLIGRDPTCNLRPHSPLISNRHCGIVMRGGRAFIRDLKSTNGTFLNDRWIEGEVEIVKGDSIRIGPLQFDVQLEASVPVDEATPLPPARKTAKPIENEPPAPGETLFGGPEGRADSTEIKSSRLAICPACDSSGLEFRSAGPAIGARIIAACPKCGNAFDC